MIEVLHAFDCAVDGCTLAAGPTQGRDGKFYGTTVLYQNPVSATC
jgi:hypothetical protein